MRVWNLQDNTEEAALQGHTSDVYTVAITSDNKYIVSGGRDKTIRIWNLQDKTEEDALRGYTSCVFSVAITSDNRYIVSGGRDNCENMEPTKCRASSCFY